jgi:hypothetical protein
VVPVIKSTEEMRRAIGDQVEKAMGLASRAVYSPDWWRRIHNDAVDEIATAILAIVERDLSAGWLIWSNEHQMWWKADRAGYTADMMCAGRYSLEAATAEAGVRETDAGMPGEVVVRAPHVSLIGDRDLAGKMREAVAAVTWAQVRA